MPFIVRLVLRFGSSVGGKFILLSCIWQLVDLFVVAKTIKTNPFRLGEIIVYVSFLIDCSIYLIIL